MQCRVKYEIIADTHYRKTLHHIHQAGITMKGDSQNFFFCFLTIAASYLHQIQKVRSVFKSAGSKDFKSVDTFDN